jgi:hypothetical protein
MSKLNNKYLKYKTKYTNLKKNMVGGMIINMPSLYELHINNKRNDDGFLIADIDMNKIDRLINDQNINTNASGANNCGVLIDNQYFLKCDCTNIGVNTGVNINLLNINKYFPNLFPQYYAWPDGKMIRNKWSIMDKLDGDLSEFILKYSFLETYKHLSKKILKDKFVEYRKNLFLQNLSYEENKEINKNKIDIKPHLTDLLIYLQKIMNNINIKLIHFNYQLSDLKLDNFGYKQTSAEIFRFYALDYESMLRRVDPSKDIDENKWVTIGNYKKIYISDDDDDDNEGAFKYEVFHPHKDNEITYEIDIYKVYEKNDDDTWSIRKLYNNGAMAGKYSKNLTKFETEIIVKKNSEIFNINVGKYGDDIKTYNWENFLLIHGYKQHIEDMTMFDKYNIKSVFNINFDSKLLSFESIIIEINKLGFIFIKQQTFTNPISSLTSPEFIICKHTLESNDFFCIQKCITSYRLVRFDNNNYHLSNELYNSNEYEPVDELFENINELYDKLLNMYTKTDIKLDNRELNLNNKNTKE